MDSMEAPQPAKDPTDNEPELEEIIDMLECDSDASSDYDSDGKEIIHKSAPFCKCNYSRILLKTQNLISSVEHDEDTKDDAEDIIFDLKENGLLRSPGHLGPLNQTRPGTAWWEEEYIRGRGYSIRELLYFLGVGLVRSTRSCTVTRD